MKIGINSRYLKNDLCGFYNTTRDLIKMIIQIADQNTDEILFFGGDEKHIKLLMQKQKIKYKFFKDKFHWILADLGLIYKKKFIKDIDIFHSPVCISPLNLSKKTKSIVIVHDLDFFEYPYFFSKKFLLIYRFLFKKSILRANHIICISKTTEKKLNEFVPESLNKSFLIYPNIEPLIFKEKKFKSREKYFLTISPEHPRKNFDLILKSFFLLEEKNLNAKLIIIGKVPKWSEELLKEKKYIKFLGMVSNSKKESLLSKATATIIASHSEGFCYPVFESLRNGTPVITTNIDIFKETIGSLEKFIFNPKDPYKLADILEKILSQEKIIDSLFEYQLKKAKKIEEFNRLSKFKNLHLI